MAIAERSDNGMYKFNSRIRYSEIDSKGNLSLESLLNYFQDCSTFHSEDVGVGLGYLMERHWAWVLSAWQIVAERYPKLCENVEIGTAPYEFKGFFGYRNFLMNTAEGERLACANTLWILMDMDSMRPVKPTKEMVEAYKIEEKLSMDYAPRKISLPASEGVKKEVLEVKSHHLDTNNHVNNGQYVRIALECLPVKYIQEGLFLRQMRAEYKRQAYLGDKIYPVVYEKEDIAAVSLNDEEGKPYCVVEFEFKSVGEKS